MTELVLTPPMTVLLTQNQKHAYPPPPSQSPQVGPMVYVAASHMIIKPPLTFSSMLPISCCSLLVLSVPASVLEPARLSRLSLVPCFMASE